MSRSLTLILGGARSGKSTYAEQQAAAAGGRVLYVATAEAWDDEMRARIAAHRAQRPATWRTVEAPRAVGAAARAALDDGADVVLVDCLTLLASNVIIALPEGSDERAASVALDQELDALLAAYEASDAAWFVVSNEVGLGIVPAYPLGRVYRDALGRANQRMAALADRVIFMVAGLPMTVK
ncbi:MAG: bifunctional adenosylcobinamide kinase/adenosylcobinamide-phosphate guanylyltransferase [Caldilinea sp.]|nr:bifunctional adenosylcobinamide kinase/adenosylcobinamide-phosphate guanylyltransferase [Caldilinea sp.]MCB0069122.1 bifunctional adenosylcobinamide kinase/adenosylcobinamide-phosphate guanylyltransferase [Caldilineaceae bacterium]MCB0151332.1 bifunctional adenosylcobinamide kinase/adenosylcobinamide-phosphate guanylyltransferase [Caldilineaceae bacterium]MCB9113382.1 bifunctional adenosylcobinamide kinase/adenosylcobinamide-phosphate guanylyltransferase [Caldilineaceae bacterium]MCB9119633.